jgi:hypothetical protein
MGSQGFGKYQSRKKSVGNTIYAVRTGHGIGIWYFQFQLKFSTMMDKYQGRGGEETQPSWSLCNE